MQYAQLTVIYFYKECSGVNMPRDRRVPTWPWVPSLVLAAWQRYNMLVSVKAEVQGQVTVCELTRIHTQNHQRNTVILFPGVQ